MRGRNLIEVRGRAKKVCKSGRVEVRWVFHSTGTTALLRSAVPLCPPAPGTAVRIWVSVQLRGFQGHGGENEDGTGPDPQVVQGVVCWDYWWSKYIGQSSQVAYSLL
ncbi:hypothetical protein M406DRAFT_324566 [Cryphonectria parasitica EP155]|uniref:Uncharacterized protein n=1 Tax=Cryphonectria parasitica (strain ATCC 38755 / EP155) TaxID=660469 RepID=A0A9P4XUF9_CRYP1|nr:uncharacterized protein M406DRAFT_324566 [Cryphonectria parasitica EP155]KAF3760945.1 hypothetical protein M406DRAFT_324566 [Cryphonectria parasitica EP155]